MALLSDIPGVGTGSVDVVHVTAANSKVYTGTGIYIGGSGSGSVDIKNSIISHNETGVKIGGTISFNEDYNLFYNGVDIEPAMALGTHSQVADPTFVDRVSRSFYLPPTSPAIDSGVDAGITVDRDGAGRPQIGGFDIGAYEMPACTVVTGVSIDGPVNGVTGNSYAYSASLSPGGATGPIVYTWSPAPTSGQGTVNVEYSWGTAGSKQISVQVSNCYDRGSATKQIAVSISDGAYTLYLPGVESN